MNSEKWKVEDRGKSSAAPEDLGVLYRRAFDGLKDWEVPPDMTDRIMDGLKAEMGILPDVNPDIPDIVNREGLSLIREQVVDLADRGKVIIAGFGRYAASIAACFVLALGLFTVNSPAGQQIIGIGTEKGASVTSEAPVKANTGNEVSRQKGTPSQSSEAGNKRSKRSGMEESQSLQDTDQEREGSGATTTEKNVLSSELQNPTPSNISRAEKKTTRPSGNTQNAGESSSNRFSGNNASQSNNTVDNRSGVPAGTGTVSEENPPQIINESPSVENDNSTPPFHETPVQEENPVNPSPAEENEDVTREPDLSEQKTPFIFDSTHPVKELTGVEELQESMGYQPALPENLPEGWGISSVEVIWGVTAQIVYSDGANSVLYRTSAGVSSISSDSGTYPVVTESGIYKLEGDDADHIRLVTWSSGDFSYSMSFDEAVKEQEALSWAKNVNLADVQGQQADQ